MSTCSISALLGAVLGTARPRGPPLNKEQVLVADVRDANDEDAHPAFGAVDYARRNVDQRAFANGMFHAVQQDDARAIQDVIQLRGPLMVVFAGAVDVHGVNPSGHVVILSTDEQVAPAASTAFARPFAFVADQDRGSGIRWHLADPRSDARGWT